MGKLDKRQRTFCIIVLVAIFASAAVGTIVYCLNPPGVIAGIQGVRNVQEAATYEQAEEILDDLETIKELSRDGCDGIDDLLTDTAEILSDTAAILFDTERIRDNTDILVLDTQEILTDTGAILADTTEIRQHMHVYDRWYALAASPSGIVNCADPISATAVTPYQVDAGANTWGAWLCIVGTSDLPAVEAGGTFDITRVVFSSVERGGVIYAFQLACGPTTPAAALAAGDYTEFVLASELAGTGSEWPVNFRMERAEAGGVACWARTYSPGFNTATADFLLGLHEHGAQ